jgi:hypothetical protein
MRDSKAKSTGILPTMAVSVIDNSGSAIPAMVAGIWPTIVLKLMAVFKFGKICGIWGYDKFK